MRTSSRVGALAAVAAVAVFAAPVAAHAAPPGDNGDVKIHKSTTNEFDERNEPHVCSFYLDAFHFDGLAKVDWHIEAWAPGADSKGETVKTGSITLDGKGHGRTEDLSLADGHFKLFWNFEGEKGAAKHKEFWTECGDEEGGGSSSSPSASASPSSSPSASPSGSASSSASPSPSSSVSASVEPSGSAGSTPSSAAGPQGGGRLAETGNGAPVGALAGVAAVLLGAGGYLVVRRRRA
ncbi:LPXTG cell wall anchor domain-containing protein [Streptomyces sp. NPDC050121]|uniref:LPXTG cell wall anchor domain-containing protein n=1 Tax=Streptomyces sp. NPDC050121 TaxID=3365601 RepID=UPI0037A942AE